MAILDVSVTLSLERDIFEELLMKLDEIAKENSNVSRIFCFWSESAQNIKLSECHAPCLVSSLRT